MNQYIFYSFYFLKIMDNFLLQEKDINMGKYCNNIQFMISCNLIIRYRLKQLWKLKIFYINYDDKEFINIRVIAQVNAVPSLKF